MEVGVSEMNEPRMKPAFHRSPLLWVGFFVLMFLGWLWADSRKTTTSMYQVVEIEHVGPGRSIMPVGTLFSASYVNGVTLHKGMMFLSYARVAELDAQSRMRRGPLSFMRISPDYHWQVPALGPLNFGDTTHLATVRCYRVRMPMWGVIAGCAIVWGGLLTWRWRRAMRMISAQAQVDGSGSRV